MLTTTDQHASDIPYILGTLEWLGGYSDDERTMSNHMMDYW